MSFNPHKALNEKGIAVGHSDIRYDVIHFRFGDEKFSISTQRSAGIMEWNGYFYTAKVEALRKLAGKKGHG